MNFTSVLGTKSIKCESARSFTLALVAQIAYQFYWLILRQKYNLFWWEKIWNSNNGYKRNLDLKLSKRLWRPPAYGEINLKSSRCISAQTFVIYIGVISDNKGHKLYGRARTVDWEAKNTKTLAFCPFVTDIPGVCPNYNDKSA